MTFRIDEGKAGERTGVVFEEIWTVLSSEADKADIVSIAINLLGLVILLKAESKEDAADLLEMAKTDVRNTIDNNWASMHKAS